MVVEVCEYKREYAWLYRSLVLPIPENSVLHFYTVQDMMKKITVDAITIPEIDEYSQ